MTDEREGFLERWSRRKMSGTAAPEPVADRTAPTAPEQRKSETAAAAPASGIPGGDTPAPTPAESVDLSDLPDIDSITAQTDVRGFLRAGVPDDLTRAALRRAWTNDPDIRDFVGLVENGWDFNNPDAIPGFGQISTQEISRLLDQAIGALPDEEKAEPEARPEPSQSDGAGAPKAAVAREPAEDAPETEPEAETSEAMVQRNMGDIALQKD
jgi:hypothetical protein